MVGGRSGRERRCVGSCARALERRGGCSSGALALRGASDRGVGAKRGGSRRLFVRRAPTRRMVGVSCGVCVCVCALGGVVRRAARQLPSSQYHGAAERDGRDARRLCARELLSRGHVECVLCRAVLVALRTAHRMQAVRAVVVDAAACQLPQAMGARPDRPRHLARREWRDLSRVCVSGSRRGSGRVCDSPRS